MDVTGDSGTAGDGGADGDGGGRSANPGSTNADGDGGAADPDGDGDTADPDVLVRRAREDDYEDVADVTEDTWSDRGRDDYVSRVFRDWVASDGDGRRTFVAETDGRVVGILQGVLLTDWEAWMQGMRVHADYRGCGIASRLQSVAFDWARDGGAAVARNVVFSWNVAGLGGSRAAGFDPCTEFRWAQPAPDSDADPALPVTNDPDAGWAFWTACDARTRLRGLALDAAESWAVSELARDRLTAAADDGRLFVVGSGRTRGLSLRNRTYEREAESGAREVETWAEYAVGAWADPEACRALLAAVARDAASVGADRTRLLIPEGVGPVSDVAAARVGVSDEPDFVMAADLTE